MPGYDMSGFCPWLVLFEAEHNCKPVIFAFLDPKAIFCRYLQSSCLAGSNWGKGETTRRYERGPEYELADLFTCHG